MRALVFLLAVAVTTVGEEKRELVYQCADARAVDVVRARIKHAGLDGVTVEARDGDRFAIRCAGAQVERVKKLAADRGKLAFRITVEPDHPGHEFYFKLFRSRVAQGAAEAKAALLGPADLMQADRAESEGGLRWIRLRDKSPDGLVRRARPDGNGTLWLLVRIDKHDVDGGALEKVHAARDLSTFGGSWAVMFGVKPAYREKMAALTAFEDDKYVAIILDDRVHSAPQIMSTMSDSGQISAGFTEKEAKALAAVLHAGTLRDTPKLVTER